MPPKRQTSIRRTTRTSTSAGPTESNTEDANLTAEGSSAAQELPSDPLAVEPDATPDVVTTAPTNEATNTTTLTPVVSNTRASSTSTQRGRKPVTAPRFTKRRSQAALQQRQKAEDEGKRNEAEVKATEDALRARREGKRRDERYGRGRGRGDGVRGRGRGGYMGERDTMRAPSGVFGAGLVNEESIRRKRYRPRVVRGRDSRPGVSSKVGESGDERSASPVVRSTTTMRKSVEAVKQESEPSAVVGSVEDVDGGGDASMEVRSPIKVEDGYYISSDEDDEENGLGRVNVEDLGVIDLTNDDPFAPVRVQRVSHREKPLGINADGATNQDGAITIDANDTTTTGKRRGKQKAADFRSMGEEMIFQATYSDSDTDAEQRATIKQDPEGDAQPSENTSTDVRFREPASSPTNKRKSKEKTKARVSSSEPLSDGPDYQTRDELDEFERHEADLQVLRNELGAQTTDEDGDATMTDSRSKDRRAEKVYLFQFPPILPDLQPVTIKTEPDIANANVDGMDIDQPIAISEDDAKSKTRSIPKLPSGAVGKLKVHASGRVTLDWGGTSLCLGMGTEASFLQDILVTELSETKNGEGQTGTATSMGQVKGKFVVTPDWEEILR